MDQDDDYKPIVDLMLQAAGKLDAICYDADEGADIALEATTANMLRDQAEKLLPPGNSWPKEGAAIYDLKTKLRVN